LLLPHFSYFHDPAGMRFAPSPDYADAAVTNQVGTCEWQHSISDVINALTRAGLIVEYLHEFPFCAWQVIAGCVQVERFSNSHGYWGMPPSRPQLPLMFSIRAGKLGTPAQT
jgi:hypothetical protein